MHSFGNRVPCILPKTQLNNHHHNQDGDRAWPSIQKSPDAPSWHSANTSDYSFASSVMSDHCLFFYPNLFFIMTFTFKSRRSIMWSDIQEGKQYEPDLKKGKKMIWKRRKHIRLAPEQDVPTKNGQLGLGSQDQAEENVKGGERIGIYWVKISSFIYLF